MTSRQPARTLEEARATAGRTLPMPSGTGMTGQAAGLIGCTARLIWPEGSGELSDAAGMIVHASQGEDGRIGIDILWHHNDRITWAPDHRWYSIELPCLLPGES